MYKTFTYPHQRGDLTPNKTEYVNWRNRLEVIDTSVIKQNWTLLHESNFKLWLINETLTPLSYSMLLIVSIKLFHISVSCICRWTCRIQMKVSRPASLLPLIIQMELNSSALTDMTRWIRHVERCPGVWQEVPGQAETCPLTPAEGHPSLNKERLVFFRQQGKVLQRQRRSQMHSYCMQSSSEHTWPEDTETRRISSTSFTTMVFKLLLQMCWFPVVSRNIN